MFERVEVDPDVLDSCVGAAFCGRGRRIPLRSNDAVTAAPKETAGSELLLDVEVGSMLGRRTWRYLKSGII